MKRGEFFRPCTLSPVARRVLACVLLLALPSCDPDAFFERPVKPFGESDEFVVLVRNAPVTRFLGADGRYSGIEQDLLELFVKDMGIRLRVVEHSAIDKILAQLRRRRAHLAAVGIAATPQRRGELQFAPAYLSVDTVVAYNTGGRRPKNIHDLVGKRVVVLAGSRDAQQLGEELLREPALRWKEIVADDGMDLLDKLSNGEVDYVVSASNIAQQAQQFSPSIRRAFNIGIPESLSWALPKEADPQLVDRVDKFFARIKADGTLGVLMDRYFGHMERLTQADVALFLERRSSVLHHYRGTFQEAQELTGIDWRLLAALGFQESHWNPLATSPTGVRGLMMLTSETADRLGVRDRLDPHQNILAGARYLKILKDTLPQRIAEPDRTWMALASYNVGYGHLEDARILAVRRGLNADSWVDLKKSLPLLARSDFYTTLKRGFARGGEAVILTENIRNYYDILVRYEEAYEPLWSGFLDAEETPIMP